MEGYDEAARDAALGVLVAIAEDDRLDVEDRISAAYGILEHTGEPETTITFERDPVTA